MKARWNLAHYLENAASTIETRTDEQSRVKGTEAMKEEIQHLLFSDSLRGGGKFDTRISIVCTYAHNSFVYTYENRPQSLAR